MISINDLKSFFPVFLRNNKKFEEYMLKEYLQYIMLDIIFKSKWKKKLSFIGGTNLRIVHGFNRFSEDLDFDNFGLSESDFHQLAEHLSKELHKLGHHVDLRKTKGDKRIAMGYSFYFPELKYKLGLSEHREAKFLIKIDTQAHNFEYQPDIKFIQKFNLLYAINSTPKDILLSMKICAVIERSKGRDFWDCIYLMGITAPNWLYLKQKLEINGSEQLKQKLINAADSVDLTFKMNDFLHLIFWQDNAAIIKDFQDYIRQKQFEIS